MNAKTNVSNIFVSSNNYLKNSNNLTNKNNSNNAINSNSNLFPITKKLIDANLPVSLVTKRPPSPIYRLALQTLKSKVTNIKEKGKEKQVVPPILQSTNSNNNIKTSQSNQLIIGGFIRVGHKIGNGNFGEIRLGKNINTGENVAIKFEKATLKGALLPIENKYYKRLNPHEGIPNMIYYSETPKYNSLVIDLLGPSLEELFNLCNRKFSLQTICMIAIQVLQRIEYVHSKNLIYRDIKPENFLVGRLSSGKHNVIHLIDLGLAKEYINSETENKNLTGTARYMSVNTHMGKEQSRRDDLEAIGHMLFYFLRGTLPWQGLKTENIRERYKKIAEIKQSTKIQDLGAGYPIEFSNFLNYARNLQFSETPNYKHQITMFEDLLKSNGWFPINWTKFDWNEHLENVNSHLYQNLTNKQESLIKNFNNTNNIYNQNKNNNNNNNDLNKKCANSFIPSKELHQTNSQRNSSNLTSTKISGKFNQENGFNYFRQQSIQRLTNRLTNHFTAI